MPPALPNPQQVLNFNYAVLTSLVLVSWEILVHLFQDLSYLRTKGWYRRPVIWAYFLQRYGAFAVIVAQSNIRLGKPPSCVAAGYISLTVGGVIVLPAISLIYLYRVLAIWNKKPMIKYILIAMWVVVWGASCSAPFSQRADKLPTGACTITRSEKYTPAGFIANAVYDATVFLLTVGKLVANRREYENFKSPLQTILLRDGVLYFAVSVAIGITDIIFLEAVKSPVVASTVIPLHIALASVMTTRLVNNVFQIRSDGYSGQGGTPTPGRGANAKASPTVGVWKRSPTSGNNHSTTILIGSGVGADHFATHEGSGRLPEHIQMAANMVKENKVGSSEASYDVPVEVHISKEEIHA